MCLFVEVLPKTVTVCLQRQVARFRQGSSSTLLRWSFQYAQNRLVMPQDLTSFLSRLCRGSSHHVSSILVCFQRVSTAGVRAAHETHPSLWLMSLFQGTVNSVLSQTSTPYLQNGYPRLATQLSSTLSSENRRSRAIKDTKGDQWKLLLLTCLKTRSAPLITATQPCLGVLGIGMCAALGEWRSQRVNLHHFIN